MFRPGVKASYASDAYEVIPSGNSLTILAPGSKIHHRGQTLGGPVLTVTISSPLEDVIRVKLSHFEGVRDTGPHFQVEDFSPQVTQEFTDEFLSLTSGKLTAKVHRGEWSLDFIAEGKTITRSPAKAMGYVTVEDEGSFVHDQLQLSVGENVYGLGERFTAFVKNGQVVDIWNKDGGTNSEQAYKNIPFYLTNKGYGVFVNHPGEVSFEVATEKVSRVQFSVPGESIEYLVIYGPSPKEVLQKYTALTGRPALPPSWSFGLWLSTSFTTSYDEETVTSFIQGMADRDLPLHVFHFDCFWMKAFHWTDLEWDPAVFPDPPAMLKRLKDRGLRICCWINPYIAQASKLFKEGAENGYLLKRANGDVWQWDIWQPGMALVDFTNPEACSWFANHLGALVDMGVDALKTDFGERIPTDVVYFDGSDPVRMHNYYTQLYNQVVFDVLEKKRGVGEAVLFARSATVGGQKLPVHWGGDCWSDFEAMADSLRGGLSLCLSGFGFWSHDIGGFEGLPPAALYKRWVAFGLLSSHSRLHGSGSYRVPWIYDDEAVDTLRFFTKLKSRLMPYLFAKAIEASDTGVPMMRAMFLEFPADPATHTLDRQYMLGDSLLVAPVFSFENEVEYYVPAGRWTSILTREEISGPTWVKENHDFLSLPLLARPNSVIAVGADDTKPDYAFASGVSFEVYALDDGMTLTVSVPNPDGSQAGTFTVMRAGDRFVATTTGTISDWTLVLVGIAGARVISGGSISLSTRGTHVQATGDSVVIETL